MKAIVASLVVLLVCSARAEASYGLPMPGFGLTERPGATSCYVNKFNGAATDTANPCGSLAIPRLTIPTATLGAGAVIAVYGGAGFYDANMELTASGTLANPVFVVGVNTGNGFPLFVGNGIGDTFNLNGTYFILLDVNIYAARLDLQGVATAARNVEVFGTISTGCVAFFGTSQILSGSRIHHCGDSESPDEHDYHGVYVGQASLLTWVLDNQIHHNGGDAIQVGDTAFTEPLAQYTFIGGNVMHDDRENAVDVKKVRDTVASMNVAYNYEPTSSSSGEAMVCHNDGFRVWFLNNFVFNSSTGLTCTGTTGFFLIGNILLGTNPNTGDSDPNGPSGILVRNTASTGIYYNTLYFWNSGISTPSGLGGTNEAIGNIVYNTTYDYRLTSGSFTGGFNTGNSTNPVFVSIPSLNFRLQASSPALNAGGSAPSILALYLSLYGVPLTSDIYGATRVNPYSIGASQLGDETSSIIRLRQTG